MESLKLFAVTLLVIFSLVQSARAEDTKNPNPNTYFDVNTLAEMIKKAPITSHEENVIAVRDFFSSTGFTLDANTVSRIEQNGKIYQEIMLDKDIHRRILGHPMAAQIVQPKFNVPTPPNKEFLSAMMEYYATNLEIVYSLGKKALNVDSLRTRDQATSAALLYYACLQSLSVGRSQENSCLEPLLPFLNTNLVERQKLEVAYINAFRMSLLQFPALSPEKEHFLSAPNTKHQVTIYNDEKVKSAYDRGFLKSQMKQFSLWERAQLEEIPACQRIRVAASAIKAIYASQYPCFNKGWLFGKDFCGQDSSENMRRISVNYLSLLDFPAVHVFDRKYRDEDISGMDWRYFSLKSACPGEIKPYDL